MDSYESKVVSYEELTDYKMPPHRKFILSVKKDDIEYEFLIKKSKSSPNLLVIGSGSYDPNKFSPPVFQRHAWIDDFKESVIYYNDPTLYLGKITLGWGNGTHETHYLKEISKIISIVMEKMNYSNNNTYLYGSSAGGYMSLMLAGYLKGTTAIVNNPQTIVANFWANPVKEMIECSYPPLNLEEVVEEYPERMNVIEFYKTIDFVPKINYLQNAAATRDVELHLLPFISGLNKLSSEQFTKNVRIELYSDQEKGHNPVSKEETLKFINDVIERDN